LPQSADARPRLFRILQGIVSAPMAVLGGGHRHAGRRVAHHRRATASRTRTARRSAPAVVAAGAVAGTAAATPTSSASAPDANAPATTASLASQNANAQNANAQNANAQEPTAPETAAVSVPNSTPPQRNAALTPADEPQTAAGAPTQAPPAARAPSRLGMVGPPAWPAAYEDVIGFTLWPNEYGGRLRVHGIGDVLSTALASSASVAARTQANNVQQARADEPNTAPVAPGCGNLDLTSTDWPISQLSNTIDLNDAQRGALDQFKKALSDAISSIKSTCRDEPHLTPVERLRALQNTLWAVHDSAQLIRDPLSKFYESLSEEQKQKFAAPAPQQIDPRAISRSDMGRMCDLPTSTDAVMRQIEQSLRPTKAQRASLDALQKKSSEMGQFLMASCLKPVPATPAERLDAAADRLTAVIFAASNVNMALNDFTSQLTEEQKAKLNSLVR
jgi:hypothetical protein